MPEFGRRTAGSSSNESWSLSHQAGFYRLATASRANDSSGGADSRVGRSSYSSRDSHKDSGSTVLVDILQWLDHFEQWQT